MKTKLMGVMLAVLAVASFSSYASDVIKVGVTVSATGPAASLGIPEKNTFSLLPKQIGGKKVEYIILDDASDTTTAVKNARRLTSEDKVDIIIGSTIAPNSLAMIDVAAESETPMISMAASAAIVEPMDAKRFWVFKTPQNDSLMASATAAHMAEAGVKTVAFIGFADAYGEGWLREFTKAVERRKIALIVTERYARSDTSVTGQVLKIVSANPDAVLVAGSGTPAALPQKSLKERGYRGAIYQTHGAANSDFLRVCGKDCEGTWLPVGPIVVAEQLPDASPVKKSALHYKNAYEKEYGAGSVSSFGAHAWDAGSMFSAAAAEAVKKAAPGTKEFRKALRDAVESIKNHAGAHGIVNMSPTDHLGLDERARVMVQIVDGRWAVRDSTKLSNSTK